jgi:hypothetical protein
MLIIDYFKSLGTYLGCFGGLGMKELLEALWLDRRRFLIEFKLFLGSGFWPRRLLNHVCFMNGVWSLLIVLFVNLDGYLDFIRLSVMLLIGVLFVWFEYYLHFSYLYG